MESRTRSHARLRRGGALLFAALTPACVGVGEIQGRVVSSASGQPVKSEHPVVVLAVPVVHEPTAEPDVTVMRRVGGSFESVLSVVPAGQTVRFENYDDIYHRFFSSSLPNAFDLGMLEPGTSRTIRFDHPGPVQVYCSLHGGKQATILVVPTRHFTLVGSTGEFRIPNLVPGEYLLETWADGVPPGRMELTVPSGEMFVEVPIHELPVQGSG